MGEGNKVSWFHAKMDESDFWLTRSKVRKRQAMEENWSSGEMDSILSISWLTILLKARYPEIHVKGSLTAQELVLRVRQNSKYIW